MVRISLINLIIDDHYYKTEYKYFNCNVFIMVLFHLCNILFTTDFIASDNFIKHLASNMIKTIGKSILKKLEHELIRSNNESSNEIHFINFGAYFYNTIKKYYDFHVQNNFFTVM